MARNCEKHFVGLNRVFLEEQWKREEDLKRPPLYTLKTADDVRKWIPSIKRDLDYYLRQLSGARKHDYTPAKFDEFEKKVEDLHREHKRFVKKVFELDPSQQGVPWEPKGYTSKRKQNQHEETDVQIPNTKKKKIVLNILKKEKAEEKK
ncbi:uncharacterized protein LOC130621175 [Hydractinia symbiolongicarpus]|uniref:uncharacterized protein LOC130621175 n=1 Tax=Hydractinia symbiolongicarpus TaxID=13093 RepID=UPI002550F379|nr:uncharacterized protein LOC130621175 [Hydractinia symbiolongicarpus]